MKQKLKPNQVAVIKKNADILRSFPTFSMELSNKLNALTIAVKEAVKSMDEQAELFNEKKNAIQLMAKGEGQIKAIKQLEDDVKKVNNKEYEVEITPLKLSDFKDLDINGDKHVEQGNGMVAKYNYRDAYFELINEGMIV